MDNILRPNFGGGKKQGGEGFPDIRFGESQNLTKCSSCGVERRAGFWVIKGQVAILVCIQCTAMAILKYQDTHLGAEKVFQVDAEVPPEMLTRIVEKVTKEFPEIPEHTVARISKMAIDLIE